MVFSKLMQGSVKRKHCASMSELVMFHPAPPPLVHQHSSMPSPFMHGLIRPRGMDVAIADEVGNDISHVGSAR
jgi:hypothetical protein